MPATPPQDTRSMTPLPPANDVFDSGPSASVMPTPSANDDEEVPPKRKRGRPRKYPLDPQREAARAAAKAAALMTPWRRVSPVERPPQYPETHVMIPVRRVSTRSLWGSPEKAKAAPRPSWMYYERPLRGDLVGKRQDKLAPEPLPLARVGRPGRTRVNYPELAHWQLACRARGEQLDPRALWSVCVDRWRREHGIEVDSTDTEEDSASEVDRDHASPLGADSVNIDWPDTSVGAHAATPEVRGSQTLSYVEATGVLDTPQGPARAGEARTAEEPPPYVQPSHRDA